MNNTTKLLMNHLFCHAMIIPAVLYGELWMICISFIFWYIIAIVAISGGYHRFYSHNSFSTYSWYPYMVNILALFSGAGPVLTWAATHRQHHAYSDTEDDPHSTFIKGICTVYFNTWGYTAKIQRKFVTSLLKDKLLVWFYRHYFKLTILIIIILYIINPLLMIFMYCMPVVFAFHGYSLLNVLGHKDGKPCNSWIANILTAGEGWHGNHHSDSKNYCIGRTWWQFDPTAYFIKLIKTNG